MPQVERSVEIKASPAKVWGLMSSQEGLRTWFWHDIEIDMQIGGEHRHYVPDMDLWIVGTVLDIVPEQSLVLSWLEADTDWVHPIRSTFTLEAIPGGTRVTHRYDGFAGIGKSTWERTQKAYEIGADRHRILDRLKAAVNSTHGA